MYICLKDAFLSITEKYCKPDELMVRARMAGHIENVFPNAKVKCDKRYDYWYTAVLPRDEVAAVIAKRVMEIKPGSIKDAVKDPHLKEAYYTVWSTMEELQELQESSTSFAAMR
jgi:hypothetical protein